MCYDDQATPPVPPEATGKAHGEQIVLTAADGNRFHAYTAIPDGAPRATKAVIIYPDIRGLHNFYCELAMRFAESGIPAIAIDFFGRTAGLTSRDESFEFRPHVQELRVSNFTLDVQAAQVYLRDVLGPNVKMFVVGFCMGGSLTLLTGTNRDLGFAGLIPFYSGLTRDFGGSGNALDNATKIAYPVLGFYGEADQGIPVSAVNELDARLTQANVQHRLNIYPGAPHSFFDRRAEEYADASSDAWKQMLAFICAPA